jgi:hypothetical protein
MRRTSIALLGLTLIAVFALVAAGCGGGGSKNSAATTTEAAATTEAATTEAATTEATTTEATTTTSSLSGFASAANCRELATLGQKLSSASSGSTSGADIEKQAKLFKEFADKTPKDIRPDFQLLADYLSKYAGVLGSLKAGQTPDPATIAKLQKVATSIDTQKVAQASQNIQAWAAKNCHA